MGKGVSGEADRPLGSGWGWAFKSQGEAGHPRVRVSLGTRGQGKAGYPGIRVKLGTQGSE